MRFELRIAEALPLDDSSVDLVWCRDVLILVAALDKPYAELRRVLRQNGRVLMYQSSFATDRLERGEAEWLWKTSGVVPTSAQPDRTDAAIAAAGLQVDERYRCRYRVGGMVGGTDRQKECRLLHAARLLRAPERYVAQFGQAAYDIMLGDCLWHVYHMIGKLGGRVYLLSRH